MFKKLLSYLSTHVSSVIFFIIIVVTSFAVTFYAFNRIPQNIAYDEVLLAKLALSLDKQPYTLFTSYADGHATPYFYILLMSFKLFGVNNFALRFPSALSGFIGVVVFYEIAKIIFKDKRIFFLPISFIAGILFACLRWRINFIRFSFEMPYLLLVELLSTFFIFRFFEKRKIYNLILSGIFAGIAFHSYQPGRIFFVVPLVYLLFHKSTIKQFISFFIPLCAIVSPLLFFLFVNPTIDTRVNQLSFMQNQKIPIQQKVQYITTNIMKTGLMFFYKGDANGRHNFPYKPAINPLLGVVFICGLLLSIKYVKNKNHYVLHFFLYFLIALIPSLLTLPSENPHMLRTYTVIPSVVFFMGGSLFFMGKSRKIISLVLLISIFIGCLYELRTYFVYQARVMRNSFEVVCPIEKVVYRNTKNLGDLPIKCRIQKNLF